MHLLLDALLAYQKDRKFKESPRKEGSGVHGLIEVVGIRVEPWGFKDFQALRI